MVKKVTFLILFAILAQFHLVWAYDGEVHYKINESAVQSSQLDSILEVQLGIAEESKTELTKDKKTKQIIDWIAYGGEAEDFGKSNIPLYKDVTTRAYNHFHDPLKDWDNAGLDNAILNGLYRGHYWRNPISAILWGLDSGRQDFSQNTTGDWSWEKTREYYYIYLTGKDFEGNIVASTKDEREANFADCFRALGQVMHLLQDMSVPLHTRNDVHILPIFGLVGPKTFETYTLKNKGSLDYSSHPPNPILLTDPQPESNYSNMVPISGLFDRNQYNGGSIPSDNNFIGLAEYSNANFLTEDTMWTYQHPSLSDTNYASIDWLNPETIDSEDGKTDNRIYIKKTQGEQIDHFAAIDYFTLEYYEHLDIIYSPFLLDEECWKEYASKLIPRAVGYSARLLNYFFRGEIDMVPDEENGDGYIIKNNSDEDLEGTFSLYYDNESDERIQIENGDFPLEISIPANNKSSNINFSIPDNPKEPGKYILVFKGKLGNEEDAVVGKIVDINPYLLVTIDGGTDRAICFVWNIMENEYAHISDADSYPISFPCNKSELTAWLMDSYSVGGALFDSLPGCESTRLDVDDCNLQEGCWYYHGECSDEEVRTSRCVDADGSTLQNKASINKSAVSECFEYPTYCSHGNISEQKKITMEGACYGGIRSMRLAARNNSGIVTSVRTKEEYTQNFKGHTFLDTGPCESLGLEYFYNENLTEGKYTIFTPIGELVKYDSSQKNYALWYHSGTVGEGNQTKESITGQGKAYGLCYGNVMVQLYYYDYLKKIRTRPCGTIHWYGFWLPCVDGICDRACDYDSIEEYETLFSVLAQADVVNDPDNQDPTKLSRNNGLESAISSLREKFENEYGDSSEDTLTNYIISIDLRIDKSVLQ